MCDIVIINVVKGSLVVVMVVMVVCYVLVALRGVLPFPYRSVFGLVYPFGGGSRFSSMYLPGRV